MSSFYNRLMDSYNVQHTHSGVNGKRLAERSSALAETGWTDDGGCLRISFSQEELQAKKLVMQWMEEEGLSVRMDGAGNVYGRLEGKEDLPAVLSGSHLDSVPHGGHFDGPLGVLSALEVVSAWRDQGYQPRRPFEVVVFTDEEGARFNGGLTGSQAFVGNIDSEEEKNRVDYDGRPYEEVLKEVGLTPEGVANAKRDLDEVHAFIEVHIEQGKRLEKAELPVGVVTGIAGPTWLKVTFEGAAGHAGNTPMNDRWDALVAASDFVVQVKDFPPQVSDTGVATIGKLEVEPNGVNVIPGKVQLTVDIRDIKAEWKQEIVRLVKECAENVAEQHGIKVQLDEMMNVDPVEIPENMQQKAAEATREVLGGEPYLLPSGAGHDAMIVGRHVPVAMLFTQSKDGISHNPKEWSSLNDCVQTVHVLKRFVEKVCTE
ncbi:M20 family metallo-hydrolase [Tenuibacillus multivorans]|uniref:Allantoate deiminase n=1 Tax=Tenuibacillus multivorans TaxID=237069 RepID=A0A1G9WR70_9BACI|nr:M20 family metallo-hydrolase [Tenuibacillus multivorans]GEL77973.1 Zn-dependent hydrolase [Tenuibacillus multivorans]SDM86655.1 allantoate deiminase [Tenuibacillus multivorans]